MSALVSNILRFPIAAQANVCTVDDSKPGPAQLQLNCNHKIEQPGCGQVPATLTAGSCTGETVPAIAESVEVVSVAGSHAVQPGSIGSTLQTAEQQQIAPELTATSTAATHSTTKTTDRVKPGSSSSGSGVSSGKQPTTVKSASKPPLTVSPKPTNAADSARSSGSKPDKSTSKSNNSSVSATAAAASTALAATKLGLHEQLATALAVAPAAATLRDVDGRCCLHYAAAYGHEECVDTLLAKGSSDAVRVRDVNGDLPLHLAASKGQPMCAYNIAKACPASCLVKNKRSQTPMDLAASAARGEVLNALLLACAGEGKAAVAVAAMRALLAAGAVPDTWAPNGSSALMLAAAADGITAIQVLLDNGATIELQDALGRSALMFAAGNNATAACKLLLDRGAVLSARDRRGRAAVDYATAGSEAAVLLQQRLEELEKVASQRQQQLLQEQGTGTVPGSSSNNSSSTPAVAGTAASVDAESANSSSQGGSNSSKKKRKKKAGSGKVTAGSPAAVPDAGTDCNAAVPATSAATACTAVAASTVSQAVEETAAAAPAATADAKTAPLAPTTEATTTDVSPPNLSPQQAGSVAKVKGCSLSRLQKDQPNQQQNAATGVEVVTAAESAVAENGFASCPELGQGGWQVVKPKGKQRAACPLAAGQVAAVSSGDHSSSSSHCGRSMNKQLHHIQCVNGLRQQQQQKAVSQVHSKDLLQRSSEPNTTSSSMSATARVDGSDLSSTNTCHLIRLDPGHRRQGSSHSLCSTVSMSSYDSCCNSSGPGSIVAAGTPVSSCCSCISCCSHQSQTQQQHKAAGGWGCAMGQHICGSGSGSNDQQGCVACSKIGRAEDPASACTLGVALTCKPAVVAAVCDAQHPARFKAALLGVSGAPTSAAAGSGSIEQQQLPPSPPPRPKAAATSTAMVATTSDQQQATLQHQAQGVEISTCRPEQQQQVELQQQQEQLLQQQLQQAEAEVATLQLLLKQQSTLHQQQLAAILEDAASHEAAAVAAARQAAAANVLQSPLLWQLLAAAAQQAVLTERARLQLRLQQVGLPLDAQLQLLLGPVAAVDTALYPATDAGMAAHSNKTAAAADGKGSSDNSSMCSSDTTAAIKDAFASAVAAVQQQKLAQPAVQPAPNTVTRSEQQQRHEGVQCKTRDDLPLNLQMDLRSEYCGGGSSFVAPAKQDGDAMVVAHSSSRRSSSVNPDSSCCTVAATRSSSSSSLDLSTADDAEVQEADVGGFGAIGGPSSCHNSCNSSGSPQSCYSGARALSCSPFGRAAAAGSSNNATGAGQAAGARLAALGDQKTQRWLGRNSQTDLEGRLASTTPAADTVQPIAMKLKQQSPKVLQPVSQPVPNQSTTPVFAGLCLPQLEELHKLAAAVEPTKSWSACVDVAHAVEHELVGGLLMDEDCVTLEKGFDGGGVCKLAANVVDLLPDYL